MRECLRILVLREDGLFSRQLRDRGYDVGNMPLIATRRIGDLSRLKELLVSPERFVGIFVTSITAAEVLAEELAEIARDKVPTIYVHGTRSREFLGSRGFRLEFEESANTVNDLIDKFGLSRFSEQHLLFVRGDRSLRIVPDRLGAVAKVDEVVVYETVEVPMDPAALEKLGHPAEFDRLCFFSPSAVDSYVNRGFVTEAHSPRIAVIGETTAQAVVSSGLKIDYISQGASQTEFAKGLARHIENH